MLCGHACAQRLWLPEFRRCSIEKGSADGPKASCRVRVDVVAASLRVVQVSVVCGEECVLLLACDRYHLPPSPTTASKLFQHLYLVLIVSGQSLLRLGVFFFNSYFHPNLQCSQSNHETVSPAFRLTAPLCAPPARKTKRPGLFSIQRVERRRKRPLQAAHPTARARRGSRGRASRA